MSDPSQPWLPYVVTWFTLGGVVVVAVIAAWVYTIEPFIQRFRRR